VKGGSQMTASESRFNLQTRTPTGYGEFKTFIEGDFTNPSGLTNSVTLTQSSNSTGFRLRQAYGTLGPFLVGQTFSLFNDVNANGEELDFGGDPTAGRVRQPQVRYTYDSGGGLLFMGSIENASATFEANAPSPPNAPIFAGTTFGAGNPNGVEQIPDFIGRVEWDQAWGHLSGRAVMHPINFRTAPNNPLAIPAAAGGVGCGGCNNSAFGWGIGLSGDVKTWGKDDLTFQVNGGNGGGSYVSGGNNPIPEAIIDATGTLQTIGIVDFNVSYAHWWTDTLRTNVAGGYAWISQPGNTAINYASTAVFNGEIKDYYTAHANLIWSPVPQIDTGVEFVFGHRDNEDSLGGNIMRFQASTKFKF